MNKEKGEGGESISVCRLVDKTLERLKQLEEARPTNQVTNQLVETNCNNLNCTETTTGTLYKTRGNFPMSSVSRQVAGGRGGITHNY